MKDKFVVFHIDGGIGKNIIATAVVRALFKFYEDRKLIVVTAHEDFWLHNPYVFRCYRHGQLTYFYDSYVKDCDTIFLSHDPYRDNEFIKQSMHLSEVWCKMFNIPFDGPEPEVYFNPLELMHMEATYNFKDPFIIIQPYGGINKQPYSWTRDIPAENSLDIVNHYNRNGVRVLQLKSDTQPLLPGAEALTIPLRHVSMFLMKSKANYLIDSFAQHLSAALFVQSKVFWIANTPTVFGHTINENIIVELQESLDTKKYSYIIGYDAIAGNINEFPYNSTKLFDSESILGLK